MTPPGAAALAPLFVNPKRWRGTCASGRCRTLWTVALTLVSLCASLAAQPTTLHSRGNDEMRSTLLAWEQAFAKLHPEVTFDDILQGSGSGMAGIITSASDLAVMGRPATSNEIKGFEWVFRNKPLGIAVATGALQGEGKSAALALFVASNNPITSISMTQLAAILGCPAGAPASPTWAKAGATGPQATHPIHVYLPDMSTNTGEFLQQTILHDHDGWNWRAATEYKDAGTPAGSQIVEALRKDPDGLAITTLDHAGPGLKAISLAGIAAPVFLTPESLTANTYPLARQVFFYLNRRKDQPVDPKVKDFLLFVLSPEGQALIPRSGSYLPLSSASADLQRAKLQ